MAQKERYMSEISKSKEAAAASEAQAKDELRSIQKRLDAADAKCKAVEASEAELNRKLKITQDVRESCLGCCVCLEVLKGLL